MKKWILFISILLLSGPLASQKKSQDPIIIDETDQKVSIEKVIKIDKVWAGHPVGFCLLTHKNRQYIAYYNADRNMVVGQRTLNQPNFELYVMPPTERGSAQGTSTVLGWDSHNYITLGIDMEGYIHLSGNMHVHSLTYFRSKNPGDITSLFQLMSMVGENEDRCTYPKFLKTREGELIFTYRDGGSGNGNQIYNIYSCENKTWSRLLDTPLTDGLGLMNAYISQPKLMTDNWYHTFWVWRDTPDCETNHDLSYIKSPDLKNWFNAYGGPIDLPVTLKDSSVIVDPIPPKGGIINLAAKLCLDKKSRPAFAYHKYDEQGNLQFYTAWLKRKKWIYKQVTDWDYRWEFSGRGSINSEVVLKDFNPRDDGYYELNYWHIKYGDGTILLNNKFENCGKVLKPEPFKNTIEVEGNFPDLLVQTSVDIRKVPDQDTQYILKWETLNRNRDRPRPEPWPEPSQLYLYQLKMPD